MKMPHNIATIRVSTTVDLPAIREIWEDKFPAETEYYNTVFNSIIPYCTNYICTLNDKIVSVISLMPMKFINLNENITLNGWYLFGVATRSCYEGKGLASSLIKRTCEDLKIKGFDFIIERPANQALNNFYLKLGFTISIKKQKHLFPHEIIDKTALILQDKQAYGSDSTIKSAKQYTTYNHHHISLIIESISQQFSSYFKWENDNILNGLLELGELERHNQLQTEESFKEETYIALAPLKQLSPDLFKEAFFCFPME